jgi:tetratricopeptide (TPR) repeat protein
MKILGVIGVIGAVIMILAGVDMTRIVSQATAEGSAPSINEVFYNWMGLGFIGLGVFCIILICVVAFRQVQPAKDDEEEGDDEEQKENANADHKLGDTYDEKEEYDKAIADYNKAIELNPNDADAYYNRGVIYGDKGEVDKAVCELKRCIELSTDSELVGAAQQALREAKKSP